MNWTPLPPFGPTSQVPDGQHDSHDEQCAACNDAGDERGVDDLDGSLVARHFSLVETLSSVALEEDALVPEDARDETVHVGLREETTAILVGIDGGDRLELCGALDFMLQEIADVDGTIFTAQHPSGHTSTLDFVTVVLGDVAVGEGFEAGRTGIKGAIERLLLIDPD